MLQVLPFVAWLFMCFLACNLAWIFQYDLICHWYNLTYVKFFKSSLLHYSDWFPTKQVRVHRANTIFKQAYAPYSLCIWKCPHDVNINIIQVISITYHQIGLHHQNIIMWFTPNKSHAYKVLEHWLHTYMI